MLARSLIIEQICHVDLGIGALHFCHPGAYLSRTALVGPGFYYGL
jgi:hypothetical protein